MYITLVSIEQLIVSSIDTADTALKIL